MTTPVSYAIGTSYAGMVDLTAITSPSGGIPNPFPAPWAPYTEVAGMTGDGKPVTTGFPTLTWHWDWMLYAWVTYFLTTVMAGAYSASVYVQTRTDDGTFKLYTATMWRPTSEHGQGGRRMNVDIRFTHLVAYTPPAP